MNSAVATSNLPIDVRLTQFTAGVMAIAAAVLLLGAGVGWVARQPYFAVHSIQIEGDVTHNSVATIRANTVTRLQGNFFNLDLQAVRATFENLPWVRQAVVRRVWPDRLVVRLEEQRAAAVWAGDEGNDRLVNTFGDVFDANVGDVDEDRLPVFDGPEDSAETMLEMYHRLVAVFQPMDLTPARVSLSDRGSWQIELDNGAVVEIGRGTEDEVVARCARFVRTVAQVAARQPRGWSYADLRHADGYALRLKPAAGEADVTTHTTN
jgi:cell division protein FtsQ